MTIKEVEDKIEAAFDLFRELPIVSVAVCVLFFGLVALHGPTILGCLLVIFFTPLIRLALPRFNR